MNINLIKEFVLCSAYYTKQLGPCLVPTFVFSRKDGRKVEIMSNRNAELWKDDSSYVRNFKRDICKLSEVLVNIPTGYIEEFPVVIDNREMWNQILDYYEVPKYHEMRDRQYFLLDFFFPNTGFVVEIDSEYHIGKEVYDKARDHYMWSRYNLRTFRFGMYGKDLDRRAKYVKDLEKIFREFSKQKVNLYSYGNPRYIDQTDIIVDNFFRTNSISLEFIDNLYKYTGSSGITRKIVITMKDVDKLLPGSLDTFKDQWMISSFLDNTSSILKGVYGVELYIQDTTEYTLHSVLRILEISRMPNKWDEFLLQSNIKRIPRWVVDIMGGKIPKKFKKSVKIDNDSLEDSGVLEFVKALEERMLINTAV